MKLTSLCFVCSALSAHAAITYYSPTFGGGEMGWQLALLANSITVTADPLSLDPMETVGSGIVSDTEGSWSSSNIHIRPEVLSPLGIDYAVINEGMNIDVSTDPQNVIALEPGFATATPAAGFIAVGFNYTVTLGYSVSIYVSKIDDSGYSLAPSSIGATSSGFWGFVADDPADAIDSVVFVQSSFPGPGIPEFSMENIRVSPIPEPSGLLLVALALPTLLRRRRSAKAYEIRSSRPKGHAIHPAE